VGKKKTVDTRFETMAGHSVQGRRRVNRKITSINNEGSGFITPIECANGAWWDLNIIWVFDNWNRLWLAIVWETLSKGRPSRTVKD
jgi:hypothetical protein